MSRPSEAIPPRGYTGAIEPGEVKPRRRTSFPSQRQIKFAAREAGISADDAFIIARDYFAYGMGIPKIVQMHYEFKRAQVSTVVTFLLKRYDRRKPRSVARGEAFVHLADLLANEEVGKRLGLMVGKGSTLTRLVREGYDPDVFVPVADLDPEVFEGTGIQWADKPLNLWEVLALHKVVLESKTHRDDDGIEFEQFEEGGDVFVFNRTFPGSLQIFTPEGVETHPKACVVCKTTPAGEMYHGPDLCAECAGVVIEKLKAENKDLAGLHTSTAKKWCDEAGVLRKRRVPREDRIENMAELLAQAEGEFKLAGQERDVSRVVTRRVERGLAEVDAAVKLLTGDGMPTTVPRRVVRPPVRTHPSFEGLEVIEDWFEACRGEFGYDTRAAMPHGVVYVGEDEIVVVAFDHLLSEDARNAVVGAAEAQRIVEGLVCPAEASVNLHSIIVPKDEPERARAFVESLGLDAEVLSEIPRRNRLRFLQASSDSFKPGSVKTAYLDDGTEVTFGERPHAPDAILEKAWKKFDVLVEGKTEEEIEEALTKRLAEGNSGLGRKVEAVLHEINALADYSLISDTPADLRAYCLGEKMVVQKLLLPTSKYDSDSARAWAEKHGYNVLKVTTKDEYIHVRVRKPKKGKVTRTIEFGKGIKAVGQRVAASKIRVHDDPADMERLLKEIALHNLVAEADKVAVTGPRSWALGYPDGGAAMLLYFPRRGIARVYAKEFMEIAFEGEPLTEQFTGQPQETEEETQDQMLDAIVRKLLLNGSLDALQDVEFDEEFGSIYLFFSAVVQRQEIDEILREINRAYPDTQLVGSPDQSLEGEVGDSDWWVLFVPGKNVEGVPGQPDPAVWGAEQLPAQVDMGLEQHMDKETVQAIAKGVSVDAAIDALTKESMDGFAENDFNPMTLALAVAGHFGLGEKDLDRSALAPNAVYLDVPNAAGALKRLEFAEPGFGGGVNIVLDAADGQREIIGHFKTAEITEIIVKLEGSEAWKS